MRLRRAKRRLANRHWCRLLCNSGKEPGRDPIAIRHLLARRLPHRRHFADELIRPMLPLLAIMFGAVLCVTYLPERFMWLRRAFGFAPVSRPRAVRCRRDVLCSRNLRKSRLGDESVQEIRDRDRA